MKTWTFNGHDYEMEKTGYGQYKLNRLHCTDSSIWDWCDDDSDEDKHLEALQTAETYVMTSKEDNYSNVKDLSEDEYEHA